MNWKTHVPNIFDIGFNETFIRFLHVFSVYYTEYDYTSTRVVIRVIITQINDNRFYDTSIYIVFFAVFFFSIFTTCSYAFVHTSFVFFPKAAYASSLTSFNRKVVLFGTTKPLICAHINYIGLSSQCGTGVFNTSCPYKFAILCFVNYCGLFLFYFFI
jgi:hypothetical protein